MEKNNYIVKWNIIYLVFYPEVDLLQVSVLENLDGHAVLFVVFEGGRLLCADVDLCWNSDRRMTLIHTTAVHYYPLISITSGQSNYIPIGGYIL